MLWMLYLICLVWDSAFLMMKMTLRDIFLGYEIVPDIFLVYEEIVK